MTTHMRIAGQPFPLPWMSDAVQNFACAAFEMAFANVDERVVPEKIHIGLALAPGPPPDMFYIAYNQLIRWLHASVYLCRHLHNQAAADRYICLAYYFTHEMMTFEGLLRGSVVMGLTDDAIRQQYINLSTLQLDPRRHSQMRRVILLHLSYIKLFTMRLISRDD